MSSSRRGLKRVGMRSYQVGTWIITKDRPRRWLVRHAKYGALAWDFFAVRFPTLRAARSWAYDQIILAAPIVSRRHKRAKSRQKLAKLLTEARQ